jgi:murein DD-endopeptidase / murein LD-carboxypeptidase
MKIRIFFLLSFMLLVLSGRGDELNKQDEQIHSFLREHHIPYDSACTNLELYREVMGWIGVKYKYTGLTKNGVDCAGFVTNICNKIYSASLSGSAGNQFSKCAPIEKDLLEEGDLVFFKINKTYISHVGLYLANGRFVHASVHGGVMVSSLEEAYYSKYYYISGRLLI